MANIVPSPHTTNKTINVLIEGNKKKQASEVHHSSSVYRNSTSEKVEYFSLKVS